MYKIQTFPNSCMSCRWLRTNEKCTEYHCSHDPLPLNDDRDSIIFVDQQGICEYFGKILTITFMVADKIVYEIIKPNKSSISNRKRKIGDLIYLKDTKCYIVICTVVLNVDELYELDEFILDYNKNHK